MRCYAEVRPYFAAAAVPPAATGTFAKLRHYPAKQCIRTLLPLLEQHGFRSRTEQLIFRKVSYVSLEVENFNRISNQAWPLGRQL